MVCSLQSVAVCFGVFPGVGLWHYQPLDYFLKMVLSSHRSGCSYWEALRSITSSCSTAALAPTGLLIAPGKAQKYPFLRGMS